MGYSVQAETGGEGPDFRHMVLRGPSDRPAGAGSMGASPYLLGGFLQWFHRIYPSLHNRCSRNCILAQGVTHSGLCMEGDVYKRQGIIKAVITSGIVFLAVALGTDTIGAVVDALPQAVLSGLDVVAAALPALGFAMLLNIMWDRRFLPFYFIGFALAVYFGVDIMAVTVLAVAFAAFRFMTTKDEVSEEDEF